MNLRRWLGLAVLYFRREIRVTLQQIGFIRSNDGTPENPVEPPIYSAGPGLGPLASVADRLSNLN